MGIDNLQLSNAMIAELYPESLVSGTRFSLENKSVKTNPVEQEPAYTFLGDNLRHVCFLVNVPDSTFLQEDQMTFLQKILSACKLNLTDISLLNSARNTVSFSGLKEQLRPGILFLWGDQPVNIPEIKNLPDMTVSNLDDFLVVPVLSAFSMNLETPMALELKQRLWVLLKKIFNL
jgi:hypothetical protein